MAEPSSAELVAAVQDALRPRGLRERARLKWLGGFTAPQLLARLPDELHDRLLIGEENLTLAERKAVHAVTHALDVLVQQGMARRERATLNKEIRGQGLRGFKVDVYRLR